MNAPIEPPAATLTATVSPTTTMATGITTFIFSRWRALIRSP